MDLEIIFMLFIKYVDNWYTSNKSNPKICLCYIMYV